MTIHLPLGWIESPCGWLLFSRLPPIPLSQRGPIDPRKKKTVLHFRMPERGRAAAQILNGIQIDSASIGATLHQNGLSVMSVKNMGASPGWPVLN